MSSSISNPDIRPKINLPLNFSASNSLITTRVPHYATKDGTAVSVIPGLSRPLANGIDPNQPEPQKSNGVDFKPRPIKHWRRQLRPSTFGGVVSSGIMSSHDSACDYTWWRNISRERRLHLC